VHCRMGKKNNSKCRNEKRDYKKYYEENRERIRETQRLYYQRNKKRLRERASLYYYANRKKVREDQKVYYDKYKDLINKQRTEKMRNNPELRIVANLRSRLSSYISGKSKRTLQLLGCERDHLITHLQVQFKKGMNWDNYGNKWAVDHHIPITAFDLNNKKEFEACWHFSNLKPMWVKDNIRKGNKICLER